MSDTISLSVFFPAYNEEENIEGALTEALEALPKLANVSHFEILVINDGSADKTAEIVRKMAEKDHHIRLVNHPGNLGHGAAIATGIRESRYEYVFFTDADLQFDISEISRLTAFVPEYQVVIGYRNARKDPWMRRMNSRFWNFLTRHLLGLRVRDTNCAFKLFKKNAVADIPITTRGAMVTIELIYTIQKIKKIPIKEVAVTHHPRAGGKQTGAKVSTISRAIFELLRFYFQVSF